MWPFTVCLSQSYMLQSRREKKPFVGWACMHDLACNAAAKDAHHLILVPVYQVCRSLLDLTYFLCKRFNLERENRKPLFYILDSWILPIWRWWFYISPYDYSLTNSETSEPRILWCSRKNWQNRKSDGLNNTQWSEGASASRFGPKKVVNN